MQSKLLFAILGSPIFFLIARELSILFNFTRIIHFPFMIQRYQDYPVGALRASNGVHSHPHFSNNLPQTPTPNSLIYLPKDDSSPEVNASSNFPGKASLNSGTKLINKKPNGIGPNGAGSGPNGVGPSPEVGAGQPKKKRKIEDGESAADSYSPAALNPNQNFQQNRNPPRGTSKNNNNAQPNSGNLQVAPVKTENGVRSSNTSSVKSFYKGVGSETIVNNPNPPNVTVNSQTSNPQVLVHINQAHSTSFANSSQPALTSGSAVVRRSVPLRSSQQTSSSHQTPSPSSSSQQHQQQYNQQETRVAPARRRTQLI